MKLMWKRRLTTSFTYNPTNEKFEIRSTKMEYEPNFLFELRHKLKVKLKKIYISKIK